MRAKVLCISEDSFAFVFQRPAPDDVHVLNGDELIAIFPKGPSRDEAAMFVEHAITGSVQSFLWPDETETARDGAPN